ncbi:MAG: diguanylate cyclase [Steroidobacteraceae bacterium]
METQARILLVDDDPGAIQLLGGILAAVGGLRFATNGKDALRLAGESVPDLILLDAEMPGMSGFQLLATLKAEPGLVDVPVIFITSHTEAGFEVSALDMGAADFIAKPFRSSLVLARVKTHLRMKRMADELRRAATTDALTGVANRRLSDEVLAHEWLRARRTGVPLSLLLIDVDHFKLYNDRYGHQMGDACLRRVAQALLTACRRPADLVARYGGEEFLMLLPETPRAGAERVGCRVLEVVKALDIVHDGTLLPIRRVSVSVGGSFHDDASGCRRHLHAHCSGGNLLLAADWALYAAKRAGRAQARLFDIEDVCAPDGTAARAPAPSAPGPQARTRPRRADAGIG